MFVKMDILLSFVPSTATPFFRFARESIARELSLNDKSIPCKSHKARCRRASSGGFRCASERASERAGELVISFQCRLDARGRTGLRLSRRECVCVCVYHESNYASGF